MRPSLSARVVQESQPEPVARRPFVLTDVGMVDLGQEADLWRGHGVILHQKQLGLEDAAWVDQGHDQLPPRPHRGRPHPHMVIQTVRRS